MSHLWRYLCPFHSTLYVYFIYSSLYCFLGLFEADILSDRIAIIAEGRLTAIASSMALKPLGSFSNEDISETLPIALSLKNLTSLRRHFADGYMLTVVCEDQSQGQNLANLVWGPEGLCLQSIYRISYLRKTSHSDTI